MTSRGEEDGFHLEIESSAREDRTLPLSIPYVHRGLINSFGKAAVNSMRTGVDKTRTPLLDPESGPYFGPHSGPVNFFGERKI